jgi:MFS family permease
MAEQQPAPAARVSVYGVFVVILLSAVYTFNFLDRQLLSILSEPIRKELGLSYTEVGMLTGLTFALFYTTFGVPIAWLADRSRRVTIIAGACAIWSLFSMACGLATNFVTLAMARIGVGVGEAGGSPPSYSLIADYFPPHRRATALALYSLGVPLGTALGSAAGAQIAHQYGWRTAFFAVGAPGVALALLVLILIREPKRGRFDVLAEGEVHAAVFSLWSSIAAFFTNRTLVITAVSSGLSAFVGYAILNNGPAYLISNKAMSLPQIALYYSAMSGVAGGLGTLASGWLADVLGRRNRAAYALVPATAFVISLPFFLAFLYAPAWPLALACLAIPHLMNNMYLAPAITVVQNASAPAQRGAAGAILLFVLNLIGLGGGPVYVGLVADHFKPTMGVEALRYGLVALIPFYLLTILAHLIAARSISRDTTLAARLAAAHPSAERAV